MKYVNNGLVASGAGFAAVLASAVSASAAIDTTAIVTEIGSNTAGIVAVGTAIISVIAVVLGFRLLRKITG